MKRASVTYAELAERLKEHGLEETEASITSKLARGTFRRYVLPGMCGGIRNCGGGAGGSLGLSRRRRERQAELSCCSSVFYDFYDCVFCFQPLISLFLNNPNVAKQDIAF